MGVASLVVSAAAVVLVAVTFARLRRVRRESAADDGGMAEPRPPENVRLVSPDGREIPLETVYGGTDGDGVHQWRATVTPDVGSSVVGWALRADTIPGRTSVGVRLAETD